MQAAQQRCNSNSDIQKQASHETGK
jgi:hypothetical protein